MIPGQFRKSLIGAVVLLSVVGGGILGGVVAAYVMDLPPLDVLNEYQPSLVTTLYDDEGKPFATFYEQRRILVPLAKIPRILREALVAVEDSRFYAHYGLDPLGIARALWTNLKCLCLAEGGSTITQQLAKVLFFTPEKSLSRKAKEALLVVKIEGEYTKDQIMEMYFNQIYFGHGAYGVEAAAQTYFKKSVDQLNLAEAATLAGLPRAPNAYSPILDPERAQRRRNHVLQRMVDEGFITDEQFQAATNLPMKTAAYAQAKDLAAHFVEHVRQYLEEKYGTYAVYHRGLKVYTTLNLKMQEAADRALQHGLLELGKERGLRLIISPQPDGEATSQQTSVGAIVEATVTELTKPLLRVRIGEYSAEIPWEEFKRIGLAKLAGTVKPGDRILVRVLDRENKQLEVTLAPEPEIEGAVLILDPRDGGIKAMVGGYDFGRSKFNRAIQAKRQPGSAFKPFVYATAFDVGLTPATVFEDSPVSYPTIIDGKTAEWSPENYDKIYRGPVTLRQGLEHSINVIAVKLIERVGVNPVIQMAHRLGIKSQLRPEYGLALGTSEVTLEEMVSAYGAFLNGGYRVEPYAVKKILDAKGVILEASFPEPERVLRPETAFLLTNVLKGVVERGTGKRAKVLDRPLAAKTGTTDHSTDVWFIGGTPSVAAGVWIGYDTKRSLGPYATSAHLAVPIWIDFMQVILRDLPVQYFPVPDHVTPMYVNYETGYPTVPSDPYGIQEYFLQGTEPQFSPYSDPGLLPPRVETSSTTPPAPEPAPRIGDGRSDG